MKNKTKGTIRHLKLVSIKVYILIIFLGFEFKWGKYSLNKLKMSKLMAFWINELADAIADQQFRKFIFKCFLMQKTNSIKFQLLISICYW